MTTRNINKIVRGKVTLKPWILSKNTTEIVNTCVQKIYKNIPKALKCAAVELHSKISDNKPENKAPIRSLRSQERLRSLNSIHTNNVAPPAPVRFAAAKANLNLVNLFKNKTKNYPVQNIAANNKKLLKSPTFKIYNSRRFGSSASSSSAGILKKTGERRQNNRNTHIANYLFRSFITNHQPAVQVGAFNYGLSSTINKYLVPARNQHMENLVDKLPNAIKVSSTIQQDLMLVDNCLKERISLARKRDIKHSVDLKKIDPMNGWHHPPAPDLFLTRLNERGIANAELQEQHRRLKLAHKMKNFDAIRPLQLTKAGISDAYANTIKEPSNRMLQHQQKQLGQNYSGERLPSSRRFTGRKPTEYFSEMSLPANQFKQAITTTSILQPLQNMIKPILPPTNNSLKSVQDETLLLQNNNPTAVKVKNINTQTKATQTTTTTTTTMINKPIMMKPTIPFLMNANFKNNTQKDTESVGNSGGPRLLSETKFAFPKSFQISPKHLNQQKPYQSPLPVSIPLTTTGSLTANHTQNVLATQALQQQAAKKEISSRQVPQATATATSTVAAITNGALNINTGVSTPAASTLSRFSRTLYFQQKKKF